MVYLGGVADRLVCCGVVVEGEVSDVEDGSKDGADVLTVRITEPKHTQRKLHNTPTIPISADCRQYYDDYDYKTPTNLKFVPHVHKVVSVEFVWPQIPTPW